MIAVLGLHDTEAWLNPKDLSCFDPITVKPYTEQELPDVLDFERRLREEEDFWGWEIDEQYIKSVSASFQDHNFDNAISFLAYVDGRTIFGMTLDVNAGYRVITMVAFVIAICACLVLSRGKFRSPESKNFFYLRYHRLWNKLLSLAGLKGMVQGFLVTAPAILIMKFIGGEGELGLIQGIAGALTAILVYVLGRVAKPEDRMKIFGFGLLVFFLGTVANSVLFSGVGVIVFILCKVLFQPIHDLAYLPTMMKTIDAVSKIEKRDEYTYIMSHEFGLFAGRAFGMLLFIVLAKVFSEDIALRYALVIVGAIQMLSLPLAKNIIKEIDGNK